MTLILPGCVRLFYNRRIDQ